MSGLLVIDTSAFIAILFDEPESEAFSISLRRYASPVMAAPNYLECAMVMSQRLSGRTDLDAWILREAISVVPVDFSLAQRAADAFIRFGKGRHQAGLNFGDCFAYALATSLAAPLLYKGDDFARTDVASAV